jgi:hypothetical protein
MYVFGPHGRRLRLLVIAPSTDAERAYAEMQKAVGTVPEHLET